VPFICKKKKALGQSAASVAGRYCPDTQYSEQKNLELFTDKSRKTPHFEAGTKGPWFSTSRLLTTWAILPKALVM
jgi:hypothetical protein